MSNDDFENRLDDLEKRMEALSRARDYLQKRVNELETENNDLRDRLADLEEIVDPDPASRDYQQLTRGQKVRRIRRVLIEQAVSRQNGKAAMEYDDVVWLFDGNPSPGHAYDLMGLAGELDGFEFVDPEGRNKQIRVDLAAVNDEALIHVANKASGSGVS